MTDDGEVNDTKFVREKLDELEAAGIIERDNPGPQKRRTITIRYDVLRGRRRQLCVYRGVHAIAVLCGRNTGFVVDNVRVLETPGFIERDNAGPKTPKTRTIRYAGLHDTPN